MRDYQRTKSNPYILPRNLWSQTLYQIRDYQRLKEELSAVLDESAAPADGQPRGTMTGDPVLSKVMKREKAGQTVKAIDDAKKEIPEEYIDGVWRNIVYGSPYPLDASRSTYSRYKSKFVYCVARNLFLV